MATHPRLAVARETAAGRDNYPALIAAATKEGQLTWYTSADLQLAEKVGKAFKQKFPGIRARVERAGDERIFARVAQDTPPVSICPMP